MNSNFSYCMPTKIVFGTNELENIGKYINDRKTVLITSSGFVKRGLVDKIQQTCGSIVHVFSGVRSHPEFNDLERAYQEIHRHNFELIVAVGGGSVMDAAKFFSVFHESKASEFVTRIIKNGSANIDYKTIPTILIPTTAGTGSEVTPWATVWDMHERRKYSLHLPELYSEMAIYDPVLTLSIPREITIQTGLDSLSHAMESIWNKNSSPLTLNYAVKSAKIIMQNLPKLSDNLQCLEYRENMMKASMYSGLAFSNTQTAIAHAISYYITTHKHVPHGIACSFTLPMLIDKAIGEYDFIDRAFVEIFGELSSRKMRDLLDRLNVPTNFEDYGVSAKDLKALKSSLSENQRAGNSLISI